jgi:hypothetical protein
LGPTAQEANKTIARQIANKLFIAGLSLPSVINRSHH